MRLWCGTILTKTVVVVGAAFLAVVAFAAPERTIDGNECPEIFDWTPGSVPTGWIGGWEGEYWGPPKTLVGPGGTAKSIYVTCGDASSTWTPYQSGSSEMGEYTFCAYGCADMVNASAGRLAVLWSMGWNGSRRTALVKDHDGHIKLVHVSSASQVTAEVDAGAVRGYHLFTVRFNSAVGASLQIDGGEMHSSGSFTENATGGFQVGSVLGGSYSPFEQGLGFAVLKMLMFASCEIPVSQHAALCEQYSAAETMKSLDYDVNGGRLFLPNHDGI